MFTVAAAATEAAEEISVQFELQCGVENSGVPRNVDHICAIAREVCMNDACPLLSSSVTPIFWAYDTSIRIPMFRSMTNEQTIGKYYETFSKSRCKCFSRRCRILSQYTTMNVEELPIPMHLKNRRHWTQQMNLTIFTILKLKFIMNCEYD